jgi:four helix bundle protein
MINKIIIKQMTQTSKQYDLEERTAKFGEEVISFCKQLKRDNVTLSMISQLIRAGTSIGANYCEANNASSKKDFRNKIFICKKESQETKYWLRMMAQAVPEQKDEIKILWKECHELTMIFQKICSSLN